MPNKKKSRNADPGVRVQVTSNSLFALRHAGRTSPSACVECREAEYTAARLAQPVTRYKTCSDRYCDMAYD